MQALAYFGVSFGVSVGVFFGVFVGVSFGVFVCECWLEVCYAYGIGAFASASVTFSVG